MPQHTAKQTITILLACRDDPGRQALAAALAGAGFAVREAAGGADALRLAADRPAAIVLADPLPDLGGPEVCARLKADPRTAPVPVLYLGTPPAEPEGIPGPGQADVCLTPPAEPDEVVGAVHGLLRLRPTLERAWATARAWRSVFDALGDGIGLLDTQGRFLRCNKALADLVGRPIAGVLGRPYGEVVPAPLTGGPVRPFPRMIQSRRRETAEILLQGRWFRVTADPSFAPDGTLTGAVYVLADVTEQVEARRQSVEQAARAEAQARALAESEARFQFLADAIPDLIWAARPDGFTDYHSRRFLAYLGKTAEQMRGWAWVEALHPDDRERSRAAWSAAAAAGTPYEVEYRIRRHDGVYRWHVGRALPMRDAARRVLRWYGTCTDIHERKRLEQELRQRAEELALADRKKDEFLALLAHELRGPLAPLLNALEVLRLRGHDPGTFVTVRELAERQVRQLARLVDDLLDVSRIARGKLALKKQRVDVVRLVTQAVEAVRPLMEVRNHQLNMLLPPQPLELEADPTRLVQVLTNLLTNAAKYTEPGGTVWVSAERDRGDVLLKVRDTGVGLPADLVPRLFELFAQAEPGSQGGLGIGLHLVRGLVEMHGGSVLAFSEGPGEGSEFVVRLPAPRGVARPPEAPAGPAEAAGPSRRVLVVDDDIDGAMSLALLLRLRGHEVKVAHDGFTALEVARAFRPEVVLLDISLPGGLDGYDVARRLREEEELRDALVVALTGWGQEEDRRRAVEAGFNEFCVKPADAQALEALLARYRPGSTPPPGAGAPAPG
jgi:PAS domain S-box-containing protein